MARHRTYPIAFKRQLAQEFLAGGTSLHGLARRHDVCRNLIRIWVEKYERGEFNDEARIAALERLVGRLALENELLKGASVASRAASGATPSVVTGPAAFRSPKDAA